MPVLSPARDAPQSKTAAPRDAEGPTLDQTVVQSRRRAAWLCGGAALLAAVAFWLVHEALIDDAFITLSYARNLAAHFHWGLIASEPANSATSPLNVLLLGGATALLRLTGDVRPIWGLGVVVVGCVVAMAWWWSRIADVLRLPLLVPALGISLVLLNPFVLSAIGLEVLLIPALLVGMLAAAVEGRPVAFGVLAGLAVLARLDMIAFVLPLAISNAAVRRCWLRAAGVGVAVSLPWFAWSWWYFGSAIPDTFVIKTLQRSFGPWTFGNGLQLYLERDALATAVTVVPAVLGVVALLGWAATWLLRRRVSRPELLPAIALGLAGVAYFFVYVQLHVPAYQWYYVPSFAALSISLCVLAGATLDVGRVLRRAVAVPGLALVACLIALNVVADVRGGTPWRVPVIFGNWAAPADYARVGREVGERVGGATVIAPPEIGTLAYHCQCSLVDAFADRGRVVPLIEERVAAAGPAVGTLLDINYLLLDRGQQPRPAQYQLIWEPGPATQPDEWQTWSPAAGVAHMRLVELPVD